MSSYSYRVLRHTDTRWFVQRARWGLWFGPFVKTLCRSSYNVDVEKWLWYTTKKLMRDDYGVYSNWFARVFKTQEQAELAKARKQDEETVEVAEDEFNHLFDE